MKLFLLLLGLGLVPAASAASRPAPDRTETVVLLHGLGRTSASMARIAGALEADGYRVLNATYPSRTHSLESLATDWLPAQLAAIAPGTRVHFVTHSMGGILVRLWLRECGVPENLGRVVMLAPPNAGSELPDRLAGWPPFRWFTGVNGHRLGTADSALPRALGPWPARTAPLGIIAGDRPLAAWPGTGLPAPHDGKVSVASTHLAGASDHVVLPFSHTWLGWRRATLTTITGFLHDARFPRAPATP